MAFEVQLFKLTVDFVDNGGNKTSRSWRLRETVYADALTDAAAAVAAIDALSLATITSYTVSTEFVEPAFALPASGVQIEDTAALLMSLSSNPLKTATLSIPAPSSGIFVGTTGTNADVVDVADAALLTFINLFKDTAGTLYISDEETAQDTAPISSGRRVHRRSGKRRALLQG